MSPTSIRSRNVAPKTQNGPPGPPSQSNAHCRLSAMPVLPAAQKQKAPRGAFWLSRCRGAHPRAQPLRSPQPRPAERAHCTLKTLALEGLFPLTGLLPFLPARVHAPPAPTSDAFRDLWALGFPANPALSPIRSPLALTAQGTLDDLEYPARKVVATGSRSVPRPLPRQSPRTDARRVRRHWLGCLPLSRLTPSSR